MKTIWLYCVTAGLLCALSALAETGPVAVPGEPGRGAQTLTAWPGEPVLPPDALSAVLTARDPALDEKIAKVAGVRWVTENPLEEASAIVEPPAYSASLLTSPATQPISAGTVPRDCGDVWRERRQVYLWIARTDELRREAEERMKRIDRVCRRDPHCDTSPLDGPLTEMNALLRNLKAYADRELNAPADRLLVYRFHLDEAPGRALLRDGWRPAATGNVVRVRYFRSPWDAGPEFGFGLEGRLQGAPSAQPDGTWIVSRALTATHACVGGRVFNLEFHATLVRFGSPPFVILVRAISL